jgi:hypothetical protein
MAVSAVAVLWRFQFRFASVWPRGATYLYGIDIADLAWLSSGR